MPAAASADDVWRLLTRYDLLKKVFSNIVESREVEVNGVLHLQQVRLVALRRAPAYRVQAATAPLRVKRA
jgi:hypothetical protein